MCHAEGGQGYPSLTDMVDFVLSKHPRLLKQAEGSEKLQLEPKAFVALVNFLRECWRQDAAKGVSFDSRPYQGRGLENIWKRFGSC